ncbi:uncharacterized protein DNG_05677 [Cephalotrichum gorgonifer]|uniref:Uncharacterized protein n=1 Tax=Cephalotrichum gorgonifer TaxID=2041049 RepID=A0AAE8MYF1_9PEZI|nr:uncharacterized protein DNG_05677 [Cephalotrichum gorgonifer]
MGDQGTSSSRLNFHSCSWCQQIRLDFGTGTPSTKLLGSADAPPITIPMPFEGITITSEEGSGLVKRINELLSHPGAAGCLLSQAIIKGLGASPEAERVKALFSWIGGIEFIGRDSNIRLVQTVYFWTRTHIEFLRTNYVASGNSS